VENTFIPFHRPSVGQPEIDGVVAALKAGWLNSGPRAAQFEEEFRSYVRAPFSLAVNSGTAAMHLALAALGVGPGDEVITTSLTFCATVNCIAHIGAKPVLADVRPDCNIDPDSIAEKLSERTRALVPVHFAGLPCDMDAIWRIARKNNLFVIEDAAHAVGSRYHGSPIGAVGAAQSHASDAVAFSFYATKNLTNGEGGMLTAASQELADKARVLSLNGVSRDAWNRYSECGSWYYETAECGFKYNLSDIQTALGIAQLRQQEDFLTTRTAYANFYNEQFSGIEEVEIPSDSANCRHAWHLYVLKLNLGRLTVTRAQFIDALREKGIGASVHFIPIPKHPFFAPYADDQRNHCPRTVEMYPRLVSLPLYPAMSTAEVERVADGVKSVVERHRSTAMAMAV